MTSDYEDYYCQDRRSNTAGRRKDDRQSNPGSHVAAPGSINIGAYAHIDQVIIIAGSDKTANEAREAILRQLKHNNQ